MIQLVQVQKLDELASRECGRVRIEAEILDSIGPAIVGEVTNTVDRIAAVRCIVLKRMRTLPFALRVQRHPSFSGRKLRKAHPLILSNRET
jgi:hypothetical protein